MPEVMADMNTEPILRVDNLTIDGLLHGISFGLDATHVTSSTSSSRNGTNQGARLGLIGESGSGKSLTALSIMGLLPDNLTAAGSIQFAGRELIGASERSLRRLRGKKIAMVFQEPMNALDPLMRIGKQLSFTGKDPEDLLERVMLPKDFTRRFPHELSGGQRQRVLISMAMAQNPDLLICDEPTTALDATTEDEVLTVLDTLTAEHGTALLFISHDLAVVKRMCPDIAVMRRGEIVEHGSAEQILNSPQHAYTQKLVEASRAALPAHHTTTGETLIQLDNVSKHYRGSIAVDSVSLDVQRGDRLGIVGGSGSGKTTLLKMIAGLEQPTSGQVSVSGSVQMVFQDPQGSLNPRLTIGASIAEGLGPGHSLSDDRVRKLVAQALEDVGIESHAMNRFPHEFSGGQRQRISIARALIGGPDIVLADEAVSALDVSVRNQVLELLETAVRKHNVTLLFISHDLAVVRGLCPEVAVMHEGRLVDFGETETIWEHSSDEYTRKLIAAEKKHAL